MCHRCAELDDKIERCTRLRELTSDRLTIDAISGLLEKYRSERDGLHPELWGKPPSVG
jgi:hypothetical protein